MRGLKGKSAVVTGGSRGIGRAVVERLLDEGVSVLFTGRNVNTGEVLKRHLEEKYGRNVMFLAGDMAREDFCIKTVRTALNQFDRLDFLVNNAFPFTARALDATREDWRHVMEAGPVAYAIMIQQFVAIRGKNKPGAVVNMSSISAHIAQPLRWTYNTAKGGVTQLTRCAALDLAPHIRVNSVSPAAVWTDECNKDREGKSMERPDAEKAAIFARMHMIGRVIEPEEVASVTAFLLSDEASAVTATDVAVDGGYLAMGIDAKDEVEYVSSD